MAALAASPVGLERLELTRVNHHAGGAPLRAAAIVVAATATTRERAETVTLAPPTPCRCPNWLQELRTARS